MARMIGFALAGAIIGFFLIGGLRKFVGDAPMAILWVGLLAVAAVIIVRNLMSNRRVANASAEVRARALAFSPEPQKAALYILRKQWVGRAVGVNVVIDGREVVQLKSPRFTRLVLRPGSHTIAGYTGTAQKPADGSAVQFTAAAGQITVMLCAVEPQMIGSIVKFAPQTLDQARADLSKTRTMVLPDVAEV